MVRPPKHPHSMLAWTRYHIINVRTWSSLLHHLVTHAPIIVELAHFLICSSHYVPQSAETVVHQLQVGSKHLFNCCVNLTAAADVVYRNI